MKETMTVHKALSELKVLDSRIVSGIGDTTFAVANKHSNSKIGGESIADFCAGVKEKYQSIRTLINRRNAIKRAVTRSNAVTEVKIGNKTYTVAEAIDMKSTGMAYLQTLVNRMSVQYDSARKMADANNGDKLGDRVDAYVAQIYQGADKKVLGEEMKKVREDFIAAQTMEIVDPINVAKTMSELKEMIADFTSEVDSALSVSNALTTVDIEYETV